MNMEKRISVALIVVGIALLGFSFASNASTHAISSMRFIAFDLIFLSWLSYLSPRSDADLKRQAISAGHFLALSIATIGFVVVTAYLVAGMPAKLSDPFILTVLLIALPAALIVPILAKTLQRRIARTN